MSQPRILIKLGGAALDGAQTLAAALTAIHSYRGLGYEVILVHGGGPAINAELTRRGIQWTFVGGQRVTSREMMDVIEMVLCGGVNRRLVRYFAAQGLPAVGFSGADQNLLMCKPASLELGLVGAIQKVNAQWLEQLLALGMVPVIAPLGIGAAGESYNINADWAASRLAAQLQVQELLFLTDQAGILDEEGQLITAVSQFGLQQMIECKVVSGGMLAKTQATLFALEHAVPVVRILRAQALVQAEGLASGTTCRLASEISIEGKNQVHAAI
jgi:acetylglutamate kinase